MVTRHHTASQAFPGVAQYRKSQISLFLLLFTWITYQNKKYQNIYIYILGDFRATQFIYLKLCSFVSMYIKYCNSCTVENSVDSDPNSLSKAQKIFS